MQHDLQQDPGYQRDQTRDEKAEAREAAQSAKDAAAEVGDQIKQEAQHQAENMRRQAASVADEQRSEAADTVAAVAAALHAGVSSLESDGQQSMAGYWRSAAESIDQLADRVKDKPAGEVLSEAEHYVREQPGLGFGGAMVAGFMLARFLKSSSRGRGAPASTSAGNYPGPAYRPATHGGNNAGTPNPIL
jgi:hypothetical protein